MRHLEHHKNQQKGDHVMFIRQPRGQSNRVISLHGKALDIIRLPEESVSKKHIGFNMALVIIHDLSNPPNYSEQGEDGYWKSFTQLAEVETDNRMVSSPLKPLLNKICDAMARGDVLFDLENEKTSFINYENAQKIDDSLNSE
jgi:hypothetical protein